MASGIFRPIRSKGRCWIAPRARFVVATSDGLSLALTERGIPHMRGQDGIRYLTTFLEPSHERPNMRGLVATHC
jgi:hypothetical protein